MKAKHSIRFMGCLILCLTFNISHAQLTSGTLKSNQLSLNKTIPVLFAMNLKTDKIDFIVKKETDLKAQLYKLEKTYPNYEYLSGKFTGDYKLTSGMVKPYSGGTLSLLFNEELTSKIFRPGDQFLPGDQYIINYDPQYFINTTIVSKKENELIFRVN